MRALGALQGRWWGFALGPPRFEQGGGEGLGRCWGGLNRAGLTQVGQPARDHLGQRQASRCNRKKQGESRAKQQNARDVVVGHAGQHPILEDVGQAVSDTAARYVGDLG